MSQSGATQLEFCSQLAEVASKMRLELTHNPQHVLGQRRFHRGGGLVPHTWKDMGVAVQGKGHGSVTKKLLDEFGMVAAREQQRGTGVSKIVEADVRQPGPLEEWLDTPEPGP